MPTPWKELTVVRFEGFDLDVRAGELRRPDGSTTRLGEQPFRILLVLLDHPGSVVPREEIRKKLWPNARNRSLVSRPVVQSRRPTHPA